MAHTRVPTTLIVVDAITGKPASNIHIQQSSQTGYISKPIMSDATTGDDGRALFDVVYARWRSSL
jgi:5-hydroxyisourate hydrolase-like protein (transthyretin family)